MYIAVLTANMSVYYLYAQYLQRPEERIIASGTGVTVYTEVINQHVGTGKQTPVLVTTEPSLQPLISRDFLIVNLAWGDFCSLSCDLS